MRLFLILVVFTSLISSAQALDLSTFKLSAPTPDTFQFWVGNRDVQNMISAAHYFNQYFLKNNVIEQSPIRMIGYRTENFFGFTILFG